MFRRFFGYTDKVFGFGKALSEIQTTNPAKIRPRTKRCGFAEHLPILLTARLPIWYNQSRKNLWIPDFQRLRFSLSISGL